MHQQSVIPHRYRYNHTSVKSCRLHRLSLLVLINQLFCYVCCTLCMHNFGNVVVQHIIFLQCVYLACKPSSYTHMVQRWEMSWLLPKIPLFGMNGFVNHLFIRGFVYHRIHGFVYHQSLYMVLYTFVNMVLYTITRYTWFEYHCIPGAWFCIRTIVRYGFVYHRWL